MVIYHLTYENAPLVSNQIISISSALKRSFDFVLECDGVKTELQYTDGDITM